MSSQTSLYSDVNSNGLVDRFGNGTVSGARANFFPVPTALSSQPQSAWSIVQWLQPVAINPADYTQNDPASYDALYGNALYNWTEPGTTAAIQLYQKPVSQGGGYVYGLTSGNGFHEADMFLTAPAALNKANNTLNHPVTISLDAKITKALFQSFLAAGQKTYGAVGGTVDVGLDLQYNGAGGLPKFSGYSQITPFTSFRMGQGTWHAQYKVYYSTAAFSTNATASTQFVYGNLFKGDGQLPIIPSDAAALPDTLTYSVNKYAYAAIQAAFKNYSAAQQANLFNLANWSLAGVYTGPATNNNVVQTGVAGNALLSLQLSNINITSDLTNTYNPANPAAPVAAIDHNPQIGFYDTTMGIGGKVDGSAVSGPVYVGDENVANIAASYIYNGSDSLRFIAPAGANWRFGGGTGPTVLTATTGNDIFVASTAGSVMNGGSGSDIFQIPQVLTGTAALDTIVNFHPGDMVDLLGKTGQAWSYGFAASGTGATAGETLTAKDGATGIAQSITFTGLPQADIAKLMISQNPSNGALIIRL